MSKSNGTYKKTRESRKRRGLCPYCGSAPSPGYVTCCDCHERKSHNTQRVIDKRRRDGFCIKCGEQRPKPGCDHCDYCLRDASRSASQRRSTRRDCGVCACCGGKRDKSKNVTCSKCLAARKAAYAQYDRDGRCVMCGGDRSGKTKTCRNCLKKLRDSSKRLKDEVFAAYGGYKCECCGVTHEVFLQIDHINNDGAEHRRKIGSGGSRLYQWLKKHNFPAGFRVLCANCNRAAQFGPCPHQNRDVKDGSTIELSATG